MQNKKKNRKRKKQNIKSKMKPNEHKKKVQKGNAKVMFNIIWENEKEKLLITCCGNKHHEFVGWHYEPNVQYTCNVTVECCLMYPSVHHNNIMKTTQKSLGTNITKFHGLFCVDTRFNDTFMD